MGDKYYCPCNTCFRHRFTSPDCVRVKYSVIRNGAVTKYTRYETRVRVVKKEYDLFAAIYPHVDFARYVFASEIKTLVFKWLPTRDKVALMITCKTINNDPELRKIVGGAKKAYRRTKQRVEHKTEIKIAKLSTRQ